MKKGIVITGATSGVGRAIALAFALRGNRLLLAARNTEALQDLAIECRKFGGEATIVTSDVTD
ncbi:SDR family NAD(P)-dependent oxidoreductase [Pedobacter sp. V48]|uniref:SDR family NAD(P)-dependent oxidoreductase n=1 Tax=Pedobacter sp. V48 TaxID=509635 RepID=UPI001378F6C8|nr:SDR family NAD(P)-dependent oxidoreductase [Pedobacter sp. V48]